ncbi:MAG: hypothetical protein GY749_34235 [Desulfobacteraceae bacterium]|nr:hypothetical protein [Desulfobacteraceae bacterium]
MLSVQGICENGKIRVLDHIPKQGQFNVIVTFLEDRKTMSDKKNMLEGLLSDISEDDFDEFSECYRNRGQDWFSEREYEI